MLCVYIYDSMSGVLLMCFMSIAMFPSTYLYAHFGISHLKKKKKVLDGNAKMRINSKNAH